MDCWLVFCFPSRADAVAMVLCMLTVALTAGASALAMWRHGRRRAHTNPACPARQGPDDGCIC